MTIVKILFFILLFSQIFANQQQQKAIPFELQSAIDSLNWQSMTKEENSKFHTYIKKIDNAIEVLEQSELFFITKTATYKFVLKNKPDYEISEKIYTLEFLADLKKNKDLNSLAPFPKYLLDSILTELKEAFSSTEITQYINQKNIPTGRTKDFVKLRRTIQGLAPWFLFFKEHSQYEIDLKFISILDKYFSYLVLSFEKFNQIKNFQIDKLKIEKELVHLKINKDYKQIKTSDSSIIDLIDDVIEKNRKLGLPIPVKDWLPESTEANKQSNSKNEKVINIENSEQQLPTPVDDWIYDY